MSKITTSLTPMDIGSSLNSKQYIIYNMIRDIVNTLEVVKVISVGQGTIDVLPVIKELSNTGEPIDNCIIKGVFYHSWQYGQNKISCIPKVGDIGLLLIPKKDTSGLNKVGDSIVQTGGLFNLGDGIYLGGLEGLNQDPTQFIHFGDDKIDITGTGTININAPTVNISTQTAYVEATTSATVKSAKTILDCANINLGGEGGKAVALHGDQVKSGNTVVGTIVASSTTTKAI